MAKEAKVQEEDVYRISAEQLYNRAVNRDIITCSLGLDIGLGGGIPMGCTVLLGGKPKTCKSTLSLQYSANVQKMFPNTKIYYLNIEGRLSNLVLDQINGLKTDVDHFEVIMGPPIYNKNKEVIGNRKMPAEQWWKILGDLVRDHERCIIIVDSISNLSSERELSEGMGFQGRGDLQKLEAQFCRQYADLVVPKQITLFLLAQVQANTSGYGDALQIKCGNAIRHSADIIMFARSVEKWKPEGKEDGRILGHDINMRIECSALGPPWIETVVPLRYGVGIDTSKDVVAHAINWDIVKAKGAWMQLPFVENEGKFEYKIIPEEKTDDKFIQVQGAENTRSWFLQHPTEMALIEKSIRDIVLVRPSK